MKNIALKILDTLGLLFAILPIGLCVLLLEVLARLLAVGRRPENGLRLLLRFNNRLYVLTTKLAITYGNGIHPKHRLTRYHQFFMDRIHEGEHVLDIGCGVGVLAYDIAQNTGATLTAVDIVQSNIDQAKAINAHEKIEYLQADATKTTFDKIPETIVLSNVLEHIENRVEFLSRVRANNPGAKILLRVPMYDRDWRVPLMEELGVDYRLDPTHFTEYKHGDLDREATQAGFQVTDVNVQWGELYCVLLSDPKT